MICATKPLQTTEVCLIQKRYWRCWKPTENSTLFLDDTMETRALRVFLLLLTRTVYAYGSRVHAYASRFGSRATKGLKLFTISDQMERSEV